MDNPNYAQILSQRILALRKEKNLTQEALANQLGVSYQAVSKWENAQSCPDIALLPVLADVFEVTVDSLFGREAPAAPPVPVIIEEPVFATGFALPWPDDRELRGVVYWGRKLLGHDHIPKRKFTFNISDYTWILRYSPLNVTAECGLQVEGNIQGNAEAGGYISCGNVDGNTEAGGYVRCGNVGGGAEAGGYITCGNVDGNAQAGGYITCGDVGGDAEAGNEIKCHSIAGDAKATTITVKGNK